MSGVASVSSERTNGNRVALMRAVTLWFALTSPVSAFAGSGDDASALRAYDSGDIVRAEALWRQEMEAGSPDAAMALAALVEPGGEGREDLIEARALYRFAAQAGDPLARRRLAELELQFGATISSPQDEPHRLETTQ